MSKKEYGIFDTLDKRTLKNFNRHCWYKMDFKIRFSKTNQSEYLGWKPMYELLYKQIKKAIQKHDK